MGTTGSNVGGDAKSRVLAQTDIVKLISQTVPLKRGGKELVGLCPFHQDSRPSMTVNPTKQVFLCRSCKKGGSAIDFVMLRDRVDFKEALQLLADAAGIELPRYGGSGGGGGAAAGDRKSERQALLDAQSAACQLFEKSLSHPQIGLAAREYLHARGFDDATIAKFRIGFAPELSGGLLRQPAMKAFSPGLLAMAGLVKPNDRGDGHYDVFRNRLMFPIRDDNGRIIAFGGRIMPGSEHPAKYLNSPETPLFSKGKCVYGLDLARSAIVESRTAAVVEGYTDVVMTHQYGVTNVVSVLGTALTEQHIMTLRRFADRIVLLFDADGAGEAAVNRAVELFLTQPVEIAIASLPDGLDPDEYVMKNGPAAMQELFKNASDVLVYKWRQLQRQLQGRNDVTAQQQVVEQYLQTFGSARGSGAVDGLRWGAILVRVNRLTGIPISELQGRFKMKSTPVRRSAAQVANAGQPNYNIPPNPGMAGSSARQQAEGIILGLLLAEPGRWTHLAEMISLEDFQDPILNEVAQLFWQHQVDHGEPIFSEFLGLLNEAQKSAALHWMDQATSSPDIESSLQGGLRHLDEERRRKRVKELVAGMPAPAGSPAEANLSGRTEPSLDDLRELENLARQPDLRRMSI